MLDNFRELYNQELDKLCPKGAFEHLILSSTEVRMFVYEVCKACMASQQKRCSGQQDTYCLECGEPNGKHLPGCKMPKIKR